MPYITRDNVPVTTGIEFEGIALTREQIHNLISQRYRGESPFDIARDASCESTFATSGSTLILLGSQKIREGLYNRETTTGGYEVVTKPLVMDEMRKAIRFITTLQLGEGEIFSPRSSIHVHVGFPKGLIFYKSALAMGLAVEPLLFRLAGMGNEYRGKINHSNYARPLANPPAINLSSSKNFAVLDPEGALKKGDLHSFWAKFGIHEDERGRYNPARYFALNLYSILLRGTLEFRFFNQTCVARHIEAVACLCQLLAELSIKMPVRESLDLKTLSIFEKNSDKDYLELLESIFRLSSKYDCELKISELDKDGLLDILFTTPQPVFDRQTVLTHIRTVSFGEATARSMGLAIVNKAIDPGIVDIHNFSESDRTLL